MTTDPTPSPRGLLAGQVLAAAVAVVADTRSRGGADRWTDTHRLLVDQDLLIALDSAVEALAPGAADDLVRLWKEDQ